MKKGAFVISLDFELFWGVRDVYTIEEYKTNILGVRKVIPRLIELFEEYDIHATFATVGFLFFNSQEDLLDSLPDIKPDYVKTELSPYEDLDKIGISEQMDPFHYGSSLIQRIKMSPNQEIGTHTFSHFYCIEKGQNTSTFKADLKAAFKVGQSKEIDLESLVFPRNQFNDSYIPICGELGIKCYRGNQNSLIYKEKTKDGGSLLHRGLRLLDAYVNLSGHNAYDLVKINTGNAPFNIPASRFLRPFSNNFKFLESLRLRRIKSDLTYAAKRSLVYHLWWHPHNFGYNIDENFKFLEKILSHYSLLNERYGIESLSMGEVAAKLKELKD